MDYRVIKDWLKDCGVSEIIREIDKVRTACDYSVQIVQASIDRAEEIAKKEKVYFNSRDSKKEFFKAKQKDFEFMQFIAGLRSDLNSMIRQIDSKKN